MKISMDALKDRVRIKGVCLRGFWEQLTKWKRFARNAGFLKARPLLLKRIHTVFAISLADRIYTMPSGGENRRPAKISSQKRNPLKVINPQNQR